MSCFLVATVAIYNDQLAAIFARRALGLTLPCLLRSHLEYGRETQTNDPVCDMDNSADTVDCRLSATPSSPQRTHDESSDVEVDNLVAECRFGNRAPGTNCRASALQIVIRRRVGLHIQPSNTVAAVK